MSIAIYFWLAFGVIAAVVALNKGRSVVGWFVIGALFGPFGLLAAVFVSTEVKALEERKVVSGELKKCPDCAELVKAEAKVCKHCGAKFEVDVDANSNANTEPKAEQENPFALHEAVWEGNWATAKRLLAQGASIARKNDDGYTPLDLANQRGDKLIIKLLESQVE